MATSTSKSTNNGKTRERLTDAAHHAVDQVSERAATVEDGAREVARDVKERARAAKDRAQEGGEQLTSTVRAYIDEKPLSSLAIAFGAGIVISALLRR